LTLLDAWKNSSWYKGTLKDWVLVNPATDISRLSPKEIVSFVPMESVGEKNGEVDLQESTLQNVLTGYTRFSENDIIFAKITPCMQNGKCAVVRGLRGKVGFGSTEFHVLRPKTTAIIPDYIWAVLTLDDFLSAAQASFTGSAGQQRVSESFIKSLPIPIPPKDVQKKLVAKMQAARDSRKQKLAQADELFAGMDEFLFKQLGFTAPIKDRRFVFGVPISGVTSERIDPHFYHPYFVKLLTMIRQIYHKRLLEFVELSHKQWNPQKATEEVFNYIEISGVNRNTAEIYSTEVQTIEAPSRARMIVHTGDIIISLTRPHHGSIGIIDDNMDRYIASTGFAIIHKIKDTSVNPIYLWTILRSQICLQQMLQRSSGGNYPAITEDQLLRILVPIPPTEIQDEIVKEHIRRRKNARQLREEAERDWQRAKADFEAQLLGKGTAL